MHPVSVARAVMDQLPHVLLAGAGAAQFAAEIGMERVELMTDFTREARKQWAEREGVDLDALTPQAPLIDIVRTSADPVRTWQEQVQTREEAGDDKTGTTVYLGQDADGNIAAATSTSGWAWKYPGRVGDTPIAGAGFYADNRYGAAACTGRGEHAIQTSTARSTVLYMKMGMSVEEAVREAISDVNSLPGPLGGLALYAIDAQGGHFVGHTLRWEHKYFVATDGMDTTEERPGVGIGD
jgi:isoaspartyl peptidase/L-asparaginase-like protein (Ntn-hydrolase superfamily)